MNRSATDESIWLLGTKARKRQECWSSYRNRVELNSEASMVPAVEINIAPMLVGHRLRQPVKLGIVQ